MAYTITFIKESGIIETHFKGEVGIEELLQALREAAELTAANGSQFWLNDYTEAQVHLTTLDITRIPKMVETMSASLNVPLRTVHRAIVAPVRTEDHAFAELLNFNRGQYVKTFPDIAAARDWLIGQSGTRHVPVMK